jgi:hypothetical protein
MMAGVADRVESRIRKPCRLGDVDLPKDFVLPSYDGHGLVNVSPTVLSHFGVSTATPILAKDAIGNYLDGSRQVVVVLLDACGYLLLQRILEKEPNHPLRSLIRGGRMTPTTSVFPSTTAVALSTLHTGLPPISHGITGYRMYLPDRGVLANMIRLSPEADERPRRLIRGFEGAKRLIGVETIHEQLARARVQSYTLLRKDIAGSGLSEMHCTGAEVIPFVSAPDMFVTIRKLLLEARPKRKAIWAYWDALDTIQHQYGVWQEEGEAELWAFASAMQRELLDPLRKQKTNATLIFTADHGHVQVNRTDVFEIKTVPRTDDALRVPPSGTSRSGYLNTLDEQWIKALRKKLSSKGWVLPTSDLVEQGLWGSGKPKPEFRGRVGDYVFVMRDRRVSFYPYYEGALPEHQLGGRHGGLHEEEMLTPFIIRRI